MVKLGRNCIEEVEASIFQAVSTFLPLLSLQPIGTNEKND